MERQKTVGETVDVFGFGSLINVDSLKQTVPRVQSVSACSLTGYKRVFDVPSEHRLCKHGPTSALNLQRAEDVTIYGVVFNVPREELKDLLYRERAYNFVEVDIAHLENREERRVYTFMGKAPFGACGFQHDEPEQMAYLDICLAGAKSFGDDFYQNFITTTYVGEQKIVDIDSLNL